MFTQVTLETLKVGDRCHRQRFGDLVTKMPGRHFIYSRILILSTDESAFRYSDLLTCSLCLFSVRYCGALSPEERESEKVEQQRILEAILRAKQASQAAKS